ncbi:MAG: CIA30 family protein [Treponema sp.]|nr:CIA30 family protein [Treponema sp.]
MKKILLFMAVALMISMTVYAAPRKRAAAVAVPVPVLATGEWSAYNDTSDNGTSTATIRKAEETINGENVTVYYISGNVTTKFQYGFAGWTLDPDEATLALYKSAKAISFWVLGDGKAYSVKFKTSNVKDFGYLEYRFSTEPGEPVFIEVPIAYFMQPSWAQPVKKSPELVTGIEWQTHESWRKAGDVNPFEIKFWNFKVHN